MQFQDYFTQTSVIPQLESTTKLDAINELIAVVTRYRRVTDGQAVTNRVLEREALDSTGIGHGVAIPHARIPGLNRIVCALGRHTTGIDFDSIDGEPVKLVFLILYPPAETAPYLFIVSTLTRMLLRDGLAERLLAATDADMLHELLQAAETYSEDAAVDSREGPTLGVVPPTALKPEVSQLIRLQRLEDQRPTSGRTNPALEEKIAHVRSCIPERVLQHYDKLRQRGGLGIVASEAGICQGCHMQFSTAFAQELRSTPRLQRCPTCTRFLYVLS